MKKVFVLGLMLASLVGSAMPVLAQESFNTDDKEYELIEKEREEYRKEIENELTVVENGVRRYKTFEELREEGRKKCDQIRQNLVDKFNPDLKFKFKQNALNHILYGGGDSIGYAYHIIRKDKIYVTFRDTDTFYNPLHNCEILIDKVDFTALKCKYTDSNREIILSYEKIGEYNTVIEKDYDDLNELYKNENEFGQEYWSVGLQDDCLLDPVQ